MVNEHEIRQFQQVLQPHLAPGEKIKSYTTRSLTKPGENYGSLLLAVDVVLVQEDGAEKVLNLVAKMCPPNEWIKNMFNVPETFKKEANFYKVVSQTLQEFQLRAENPVSFTKDFFAKYYGSRVSLNPDSDLVDDDAVLLLENLKVKGYKIGDRFQGFDRKTTEVVVAALARLHAVALALKLNQPQVFAARVRAHIRAARGFSDLPEEIKTHLKNSLLEILGRNEEVAPFLGRLAEYLNRGERAFEEGAAVREPFATVGHSDLWLNNIMLKRDENNQLQTKILDFQIVDYGSPARDLIFFLYTSVQLETIDKHSSNFLHLYHATFIDTLQHFGCDVAPFGFEAFVEELKEEVKSSQLFHCLVMFSPIYAVGGAVKEVKDLAPEDMLSKERHENYEPKVVHTVLSFIRNGWL